ncbi:MAG: DUF3857 domain-containing protein [Bacteroidota bacterium]
MKATLALLLILFFSEVTHAQRIKASFVSINDLMETNDETFSDAPAKIIFRNIYFEYGNILEVHERVKIYTKEGLDYSNWEIPFNEVRNLKAATYNLEDGKIVKTEIEGNSIFKEQVSEDDIVNTITFPKVKVGSIIEISYKVNGIGLKDIYCQSYLPMENFKLVLRNPNYVDLNIAENGLSPVRLEVEQTRKELVYTGKNIPSLGNENFLGGINNYRGRIFIEPARAYGADKLKKWEQVAKYYYDGKNGYKDALSMKNVYKKDLTVALGIEQDKLTRAKKVFSFVQKNFKWNQYYSRFSPNLEKVYRTKEGSAAAINLILVAMMREAGLNANPMLVASKRNGYIRFPTITGFNNTIACVEIHGKKYLLDATRKLANFGELPFALVNGDGLVLSENYGYELVTTRTKVKSKNMVVIEAVFNPEELEISGAVKQRISGYYAWHHREDFNNSSEDDFAEVLQARHNFLAVSQVVAKNFDDVSKPIGLYYNMKMTDYGEQIGDKFYFEPLLYFGKEENPFKEDERVFPIDFLYPYGKNVTVHIKVPANYEITALPESKTVKLSNGLGTLIFTCQSSEGIITANLSFQMNTSVVPSEYYKEIKDLYSEYINISKSKIVITKA